MDEGRAFGRVHDVPGGVVRCHIVPYPDIASHLLFVMGRGRHDGGILQYDEIK